MTLCQACVTVLGRLENLKFQIIVQVKGIWDVGVRIRFYFQCEI